MNKAHKIVLFGGGVLLSCNLFAASASLATVKKLKAEITARTAADLAIEAKISQISLTPGPQGATGPTGADLTQLQNEVTVSASGGDFTSPVDAMNSITDASATNPYVVRIGPGIYDLASTRLVMKQYVNIVGTGDHTIIKGTGSAIQDGIIKGANNATLRDLTVQNTGVGNYAIAIFNNAASPHIERVTASASGGTYSFAVLNFNFSSPTMVQVTATAAGNTNSIGVYNFSSSPIMTQVTASGAGGTNLNAGVDNTNSSTPVMNQVTATASGGNGSYAVFNSDSSPTLTQVIATTSGGTTNAGVYNVGISSPTLIQVTATASGGSFSYGVFNDNIALPKIRNSSIEGATHGINGVNAGTRISYSQVQGATVITDNSPGTTECKFVVDSSLADVSC